MNAWDALAHCPREEVIRHGDWTAGIDHDLSHLEPVGDVGPILDLGCGIGRLAVAYARRHAVDVIGVDVSPVMLARAESDERVQYLTCDGEHLPHLPELGGAFSMLMFQHVPVDQQASYVAQVAERLEDGGRFVFQMVIGDEDAYLSHQVSAAAPGEWCERAGLTLERQTVAGSGWVWVTACK